MEPQIRFCTSADGTRIAYATVGAGPAVVSVPGWISHLELDWSMPDVRKDIESEAEHFTVVRLDKRGTGLSDRNISDFSLEARVQDLETVVDHLKLQTFALVGISEGGPTSIAYAARHPRRVTAMVLYGTFARGWAIGGTPELLAAVKSVVKAEWGLGSKLLTDMFIGDDAPPGLANLFTVYQRAGATPEDADAMLDAGYAIDVVGLLSRIKAPALVIHARADRVVPIDLGREIAAGIPGARFLSLEGSHVSALMSRERHDASMAFLLEHAGAGRRASRPSKQQAPPAVQTILFTDVEGSTALTDRLGDAKARDLLREHERIVREALKAHGGSEVKTLGDGFMASFGSATKALECAIAMQRAFAGRNESAEEPILVRVGLNAGEPIAENDPGGRGDLFGTAVNMAARIASKAAGGEILVADVVRQLVAGKDFLFSDPGDTELRGLEDPVRVYEVRWREQS